MSINRELSISEALEEILKEIQIMDSESIELAKVLKRVLAEDLMAPFSIPPHNNSAMDGYVYSQAELEGKTFPISFPLSGEIAAGHIWKGSLSQNSVLKIMTGALIPEPLDSVIPFELTKEENGKVTFLEPLKKFSNVRFKGEDVKKGDLILKKGQLLRPQDLGMAASLGYKNINVYKKPLVGVLATGDEIIEVGETRSEGQIYNINSYSLCGQIEAMGGEALLLGIASDSRERLIELIDEGLEKKIDILISSGGISAGNFDFVRDVLVERGEISFHQVKMRPGKPFSFGRIEDTLFFGLPGNPVASMVSAEMFIRPLLGKMCGKTDSEPFYIYAIAREDMIKRQGFTYVLRVKLIMEDGRYYASLTGKQGSGILTSMISAHGLAIVPEEWESIKKGDQLKVLPFASL